MSTRYELWDDYENLTIETPENIELKLPLAGFGARFFAQLLDSLLLGLIVFVALVIVIAVGMVGMFSAGFEEASPTQIMVLFLWVMLVSIFVTVGYYLLFEALWNGQTVGKRMAGIRVVKRNGAPLMFSDVLIRNLIRPIDYLPSNGLIGLVSFFATSDQQRLGDLAADTVVVREFKRAQPYAWVGQASFEPGKQPIPPQLSFAIAEYLYRTDSLSVPAREQITVAIIRKLGYSPEDMALHERDAYLEQILRWQQQPEGQ